MRFWGVNGQLNEISKDKEEFNVNLPRQMILEQLSYLSESVVGLADVGAVILEAGPRNQVPMISLALKFCQVIINNKNLQTS